MIQVIMGKFAGNKPYLSPPLVGKSQLRGFFTGTVPGKGNICIAPNGDFTAKDHCPPHNHPVPAVEALPVRHPGQK